MGTRASFWIGDPANLDSREWLGCIAWDGHPENFEDLAACDEASFRVAVGQIRAERNDFATPDRGWPFPWADNIFLTDVTYAFFGGAVQVCLFHNPFMPMTQYLAQDYDEDAPEIPDDPRHQMVPAPAPYDRSQPDSIMIVSF